MAVPAIIRSTSMRALMPPLSAAIPPDTLPGLDSWLSRHRSSSLLLSAGPLSPCLARPGQVHAASADQCAHHPPPLLHPATSWLRSPLPHSPPATATCWRSPGLRSQRYTAVGNN